MPLSSIIVIVTSTPSLMTSHVAHGGCVSYVDMVGGWMALGTLNGTLRVCDFTMVGFCLSEDVGS